MFSLRAQGIFGGFEGRFQIVDPAVQAGLLLLGGGFGFVQVLGQGNDPAFHDRGIVPGLAQIAPQFFGVGLQGGDFPAQALVFLAGGRKIGLEAADLAVQVFPLLLGVRLGLVQLPVQGDDPVLHDARFIPGIGKGLLQRGDIPFQRSDPLGQGAVFLGGGVQAVRQGGGFLLIFGGLLRLRFQIGAQRGKLLVQAVLFLLGVRFGIVQLLGEGDHPLFHDPGIVLRFLQGGVHVFKIGPEGKNLRVQGFLFLARGSQAVRQGGGLGLAVFRLLLLLGQRGLQFVQLGGQAVLRFLGVRLGAVQLAGQGEHQGFQRAGVVFGLLQRAVYFVRFRPQGRKLRVQGFPFSRGVLVFLQGGLKLRGQAVLFLLAVRLEGVQLLGEGDHPFFHDPGIVFRFFQRGGGGFRFRLEGCDPGFQRFLFQVGGGQAVRQGGGFGAAAFGIGLLIRQRGQQFAVLGGQAVLFLLAGCLGGVQLLGEGDHPFFHDPGIVFRFFQRGGHIPDIGFQIRDPGVQGFLLPGGGGQAVRQGGGLALALRVLGLLRRQGGLQLLDLGGQAVLFLLGVGFHGVGLLGEGDHPVLHDLRFILRAGQRGLGFFRFLAQGRDFSVQGFLFLGGGVQALFQGFGGGLIGPGLLLLIGQGGGGFLQRRLQGSELLL